MVYGRGRYAVAMEREVSRRMRLANQSNRTLSVLLLSERSAAALQLLQRRHGTAMHYRPEG